MRRTTVKTVAALIVLTMLAAACSKPKSVAKAIKGTTTTEITSPETTAGATVTTAGKAGATRKATTRTTSGITGGDDAQARAIGAQLHAQSTARHKPYYMGVGDNTIQLDFSTDPTNCGVPAVNVITAAGGALPTQTRFYRSAPTTPNAVTTEVNESIHLMVKYWNEHAFDAAAYAPAIRNLMGNDSKNQFFGRHLVENIIDGGSNQCPTKTTAGAKQAAETDHAFAVFNNLEGASPAGAYNMASALATEDAGNPACAAGNAGCKRPMHFGSLWLSDQDYTRFAPMAWTQFATGSTITRAWASYVCSKLVGQNASRSPDSNIQAKKRVFGLVHTNLDQDTRLANEFKGYIKTYCHVNDSKQIIVKEVSYDGTDLTAAQRDDANLVVQLQRAGVTSVLMLTEPIQPLFQQKAAKSQGYFPEWIFSSYGYEDSSTVQRLYDIDTSPPHDETAGDFGVSQLGVYGGFAFGAGDPFWMYHTYHQVAPDGKPCDPTSEAGMSHGDSDTSRGPNAGYCKAPTALVTWYYSMLDFIGGTFFAGPDLTPHNLSTGLQAFPKTRYGGNGPTSDPRPAMVGAGPGKYGFVIDSVEWKWRPDFTSPDPEKKAQWVEYPDCQRHYITWPTELAVNWETNGPNYNAWCGDKNGYPKTMPGDGQH